MTPPVTWRGLFTMGTVCSSLSKKYSGRAKGSLASSSDVAVEVNKSEPFATSRPVDTLPAIRMMSSSTSNLQTFSCPTSQMYSSTNAPFSGGLEPNRDKHTDSTVSLVPPCAPPEHLSQVPCEMKNLLMGRWPVLPTPESRVLRLFLACEETDSQVERTWLHTVVFPKLRHYTETLGFHLHVVDVHPLQPSHIMPHVHMNTIIKQAMDDSIDMWLILLNNKLGWRLPAIIKAIDFDDLRLHLAEKNAELAKFFSKMYHLDKNNIPPVYHSRESECSCSFCRGEKEERCHNEQELFDELSYAATDVQSDVYLSDGFQREINTALSCHSSMMDNVLVVRRDILGLPKDRMDPANKQFLDVDSDGESHQMLLQKLRHLSSRVDRIVSNECILKFSTSWADMQQALKGGAQTPYVKNLCQQTEDKLKATVSRMVERQNSVDPYQAAGLPPVLCQELLMHAHKQQQLLTSCSKPRDIVTTAMDQLHNEPNLPLILYGDLGSGIMTIAAHLAREESKRDPACMVALRFLTLTPESQTLRGVLFTVLEQVAITFGNTNVFSELQDLSIESILSSLGASLRSHSATIILCGPRESMMTLEEDRDAWMTEPLTPNIHIVMITTDHHQSVPGAQSLHIASVKYETAAEIFHSNLASLGRCLTSEQQRNAMAVLKKSPLPVLAVLLASLSSEWRSQDKVSPQDIPNTVEEAIIKVFQQVERVMGNTCAAIIFGYLSIAKFGLSDSELQDALALDSRLLGILYPRSCPQVRFCPMSIWLYFKHKLAPLLDVAYVYGHCVSRWKRVEHIALVQAHCNNHEEAFHTQLAELFSGSWATKPKPTPSQSKDMGNKEVMVPVPCSVMQQPNSYDRYTNCRKFLCLLHHTLQGLPKLGNPNNMSTQRSNATNQHLLNLHWLVTKVDATSLVQLLDDLQMAISTTDTMSAELTWLQLQVARCTSALSVSGLQLRTHLHAEIASHPKEEPVVVHLTKSHKEGFRQSLQKLDVSIRNSGVPFFVASKGPASSSAGGAGQEDESDEHDLKTLSLKPCCVNGFFSFENDGKRVVSLSTEAGEIVVWDTVSHKPVQTLKNINKPSNMVFLDSKRIVVLCNRELKAFDLESGTCISNIRGMLNIKMPYFHIRDADTVIVLARNRMSVNVLDVSSGQIHATFKAGEDRFLNSLLVSGNGNILVCGDETQKPSPLLVWELGQSKLLHDLRLPQHEFISSIADITHDGNYVACACKGLYDSANYFVVVYDLISGQLYRQFRNSSSVTALSVTSGSQRVVMTLNDGSLEVVDIVSGNCVHHLDGVKAIYNKVRHSTDERLAVSYSTNAGSLPIACTVALWNIDIGCFLASYTFDSTVMCCQLVAHNQTLLVGLASQRTYTILRLHRKEKLSLETDKSGTTSSYSFDFAHKVKDRQALWQFMQDSD